MSKHHHEDDLKVTPPPPPELKEKGPDGSEINLEKALAEAKEQAKQHWELLLRTRAEMENAKKRAERDVQQAHQYALEQFVKALIPVVDSLEQGLAAQGEGEAYAQVLHQGMELTLKLLLDALKKFHVEVIDPLNSPFDPIHHEAMVMQPTADCEPNTVVSVVQKGYVLHGRLLRPARVIVSQALP